MKNYPFYKTPNYVNMRELVEDVSVRYADSIAYSYRVSPSDKDFVTVTYPELREDVRALAEALVKNGIADGKIALIGKLSYGWIVTYLATLSVGGTLVPLDTEWGAEELAETAKKAGCTALFCENAVIKAKAEKILEVTGISVACSIDEVSEGESHRTLMEEGRALRADGSRLYENARIEPDRTALIVFTSGTTGKGKGVVLSHTAILSDISSGLKILTAGKKTVGVLPPHHTFGSTINILGNLTVGANMYISSGLRYLQRELKEQKPEHLILVPLYLETFYRKIMDTVKAEKKEKAVAALMRTSKALLKTGVDARRRIFNTAGILSAFGGNLNLVISGGAPLNQTVADFYEAIGVTVVNGYGITECAPLISANRNKQTKKGSVGMPIPIANVKIKNPDENGEGEICIRGTNVMDGYYEDPEATAAAFDNDGYFLTGDYGKLDEDGWLYITGRLKNLIILSNGKNVYPEEIENELSAIPGIGDIVVYEGISRRDQSHNAITAEIYPDREYLENNGITDEREYFQGFITNYNRTAVPYKKIGVLKMREHEFPKNTLRKIMRFKIDKTID